MCLYIYIYVCVCVFILIQTDVQTDAHTHTHIYLLTYIRTCLGTCMHRYRHIDVRTYVHTYIHTLIDVSVGHTLIDVSVAEWLAWLTSNCGRIGAIGSSPSNGLKPNMWGQKWFNPLCQCVYIYVCIVNPDIQTIHRCSHTSIHTNKHTLIDVLKIFNYYVGVRKFR